MIQAGQHRCLLSEIPCELKEHHPIFGVLGLPLTNHSHRGIGRAVINQQQTIHLRQCDDPLDKPRNHRLFVEAGRDDPESIASHHTPPVPAEP